MFLQYESFHPLPKGQALILYLASALTNQHRCSYDSCGSKTSSLAKFLSCDGPKILYIGSEEDP